MKGWKLLLAFLMAFFLFACIGGNREKQSIKISGSTTVLPLVQKAAEKFMEENPNADIQISGGGSSVGIKEVGEGTADIGMASREMKAEELSKYPSLKELLIAKDGIALIAHPSNRISSLTEEEIKAIYNGSIANWKELGGEDLEIVVVGRDSASGTREFFYERIMKKTEFASTMLEKNSNGAVKQTILQTPGAIGYVGLGYIDGSVKTLEIDENGEKIPPAVQNILNDRYPISRGLNFYTNGEPKGLAKEFMDYLLSEEGQKIVEEEGFVPLK